MIARKEDLISEAGITMAVRKLFAERLRLYMFDPRIHHNSSIGCSICGAQCTCTYNDTGIDCSIAE
jgi:hypothetical protein